MNLYRLPTKRPNQDSTPRTANDAPQQEANAREAQTGELPDALGNADFAGVMNSPNGTRSIRLFMSNHWRLFFFGIGTASMLLLFADRFALLLPAITYVLTHTGFSVGP